MALVTVVIMGLVFVIIGMTLFGMATYEFNQATYRDQSASAFWLAEAAIEHAKGEILKHQQWDAGFDSVPRAEGWYNLSISDTTFNGEPAKYLYSQGYVRRPSGGYIERDIEIFAEIRPAGFEYALFSMHDIGCNGNTGVCGLVHANGEAEYDQPGAGDCFDQLGDSCRGGDDHVSEFFDVLPPGMRTEPSFYPNTTYYYVVGEATHAAGAGFAYIVRALAPDGAPVCADSLAIPPPPLMTVRTASGSVRCMVTDTLDASDGGSVTYAGTFITYRFQNPATIDKIFHWTTGECSRDARWDGTPDENRYVIVNFGEHQVDVSPSTQWKANLDFDDSPAYDAPIRSSVINTRYTPPSVDPFGEESLVETANWLGGNNVLSHVRFIPENGIALLIHNINMSGPAQIEIGTPAKPAVFYITGSITGNFNANGNVYGTTIVLGSIDKLTGNIDFHYDPGYKPNLPPYLQPFWQNSSGHLEVLLWREVKPRYQS
jgi:hypothetical protein